MSNKTEQETIQKIQSIVNYKELYLQERQKRIELEKQLELERIKMKKINSTHTRSRTKFCAYCAAQLTSKKQIGKDEGNLIQQFKDFSEKMSSVKFASSVEQCVQPSLMSKLNVSGKRHAGMIQNFCIFGTKEDMIAEFILQKKIDNEFQGEILFSKKDKNDTEMQAAKLVFPSGMAIKKCSSHKAKQKTIQLMSYCYTNLKCFVLNFECPDQPFDQNFHNNDLLNHLNPDHKLFCICIGIHDYTWIENPKNKLNISLGIIENSNNSIPSNEDQIIKSEGCQGAFVSNKDSFKSIDQNVQNISDLEIGITQRVFCIMTYYPFFTFFEEIIRNLINIVKMQRLAIYKHNQEKIKRTIKQTDSKFQMERMIQLFDLCYKDFQFKKINFNKEYQLRLINQQKITLMTYWDEAKTFFIRQWIYSILSMFTFDVFLDLFTLIMLEDRVIFICQNSNILTHTIFLFTHILTKPLRYPFPNVSIIPNQQDFLNAPFPVVYGMLKKRKALEDRNILQNYDNTYVFLSPDKVEMFYQQDRKQILNYRSTKLSNHKELKEGFKQLKKTRKKQQKSVRYQIQSSDYCILASNQQKQKSLRIVSIINQFINDDIVKKLPNSIQLQNMRKKIDFKALAEQKDKDQHTYITNMVINDIKKSIRDPFVNKFLTTQMINNYLFK